MLTCHSWVWARLCYGLCSRIAVQMQQPARGQRPLLLFPVTIPFFPPSSRSRPSPQSVTCYQVPRHPAAKIIEPAWRGWHSKIIRSIKWVGCACEGFSTLPSQSDLNHKPAAICKIGPAEAGCDRHKERSDETMMSAGECSPAAQIRLVAHDIINHAS